MKPLNKLFLLFIIVITGCINEQVCEDVATVNTRIGFYSFDPVTNNPVPFRLDSLSVFGLGNDSLIYNNRFSVSQIEIPFDTRSDSCAFVLRLPGNDHDGLLVFDTLWFYYERVPVLISMDCGFSSFFNITSISYTRYRIDSLSIKMSQITSTLDEHIDIFPIR